MIQKGLDLGGQQACPLLGDKIGLAFIVGYAAFSVLVK